MKTEELMIGDLVNFHLEIFSTDYEGIETVHDKVLEIGKVSALNSIGNVWVIDSEGEEHQVTKDEIEPIPLTPELLEKNGFKKNNFNQYVLGKSDLGEEIYFEIGFIQLRYPNSYYSILSCGYVHEFQHILKIFGIKKEIVV